VHVPGATGDYRSNLEAKLAVAAARLADRGHDTTLGFVHIKAVDDAAHDRNVGLKVALLERIDRALADAVACLRAAAALDPTVWPRCAYHRSHGPCGA
jgi:2,3-bisphosphoglycerate-independent phosphoglycerate mutase